MFHHGKRPLWGIPAGPGEDHLHSRQRQDRHARGDRAVGVHPDDSAALGTIADNIRLARPTASDSEVVDAARQADLHPFHPFIAGLPEGYATPIGERGLALSVGQRQRLLIARALLADAPILVLDEATSNVEAAIQDTFTRLLADRIKLIIAHRLSPIRSADRIVALDAGRVAEAGTHDELLAANGYYAHLIAGQRGGLVGMSAAQD